jgi:hypothetical protein
MVPATLPVGESGRPTCTLDPIHALVSAAFVQRCSFNGISNVYLYSVIMDEGLEMKDV